MAQKQGKFKLADLAAAKKLPLDLLKKCCGLHDLDNGIIGIPYYSEEGAELYVRFHNLPRAKRRFDYKKGTKPQPYGLNRLDIARRDSKLYLCEGESDTWTLWHCDFPALGIPGKDMTGKLTGECVEDIADIYLMVDNDDAGQQFVEGIVRRLGELGFAGRLWRITVPAPHKDVSDWYVALGVHEFRAALKDAVADAELLHVEARRPSRPGGADSDNSSSANPDADKPQKKSVATRLVELSVQSGADLFHDAQQRAYTTIPAGQHVETLAVRGTAFKRWLSRLLHVTEGRAPGSQAVQDAIAVLEGKACFDGAECRVHVRLAEHGDKIYLDLADKEWRVVEIDAAGWRIADGPPVRFWRSRGLLPLPLPERGGRFDDLRRFVNLADDSDWRLLVTWTIAALRPRGPYSILCLYGQQGSAKSSAGKMIRLLIDPNIAPLRSEPKEPRDLMIAASNSWGLCYDNLSSIPVWLSDGFCCLATGAGFATRELYANDEETIFTATRPIILTSIEDVATRGDLLDRAVLLSLPPIPDERRVQERVLWRDFEAARPRILGAILDALAGALRELPHVQLDRAPRMADFVEMGVAVEKALGWPEGSFLAAYRDNRSGANETALEASPVAGVLTRFMEGREEWSGTASELLPELAALAGDTVVKGADWPKRANTLGGWLNRLAPNLHAVGIIVERGIGRNRRRITIKTTGGKTSSPSSPSSPERENKSFSGDGPGDDPRPGDDPAGAGDDARDDPVTVPAARKARKNKRRDDGDAGDAKSRTLSYLAPGCSPEDAATPFDEENKL